MSLETTEFPVLAASEIQPYTKFWGTPSEFSVDHVLSKTLTWRFSELSSNQNESMTLWSHTLHYISKNILSYIRTQPTTTAFPAFGLHRIQPMNAWWQIGLEISMQVEALSGWPIVKNHGFRLSVSKLLLWRVQNKSQEFIIVFINVLCLFSVERKKKSIASTMKLLFLERENLI